MEALPQSQVAQCYAAGLVLIEENGWDKPNNRKALVTVLGIALELLAFFLVLHWLPHPFRGIAGYLLSIRLFNCLAQVVHAAGHGSLLKTPEQNLWAGKIAGALLGYQFSGQKETHANHHKYLNASRDGDLVWGDPMQSRRDLFKGLLFDFTGFHAFERAMEYYLRSRVPGTKPQIRLTSLVLPILAQILLLAAFQASVGWQYYFFAWILPLATLYPAQIRIRSLTEHHAFDKSARWVSRTTRPNFFEGWWISPMGQNFHLEHHLFPKVPEYYLADLHRALSVGTASPPPFNQGYFKFLRQFLMGTAPC